MPKRTLAEEIARLSNPEPEFKDPEEFFDNETAAKVVEQYSDEDDNIDVEISKLRRKAVPLLSEEDAKYAGKTISRKSLQSDDESSSESGSDLSLSNDIVRDEDLEYTQIDDITEDHSNDDMPKTVDIGAKNPEFQFDGDFSRFDDDDDDDDDGDDDGGGDDDDDDDDDDGDESAEEESVDNNDASDIEEEEDTETHGTVQSFSKMDVEEEIAKGKAVKDQLGLWDSLLEGRIRLQKALLGVNKLPQCHTAHQFMATGGEDYQQANKTARKELKKLLKNLAELQQALFLQNPDTVYLVDGKGSGSEKQDSDEEINSDDSEEEKEVKAKPTQTKRKRKLEIADYGDFLNKRHTNFQQYRNNTIEKWNDKTKVASGKFNSKAFSSFEKSPLTQIEQILGDRERLVKRTQLKRTVYRVMGQTEKTHDDDDDDDDDNEQVGTVTESLPRTDLHSQTTDEEIFDDDDFYHQLLRDLIEKRTATTSDPVALGRQWLQIQKLRSKVKKQVDTKASKGRKLRYDVHQKLVNFMAPVDVCTMADHTRTELLSSLFGKNSSTEMLR
ncbi:protein AATF-like [Glandiceps talaboti]